MTCTTPAACIGQLLPHLVALQTQCPNATASATRVVERLVHLGLASPRALCDGADATVVTPPGSAAAAVQDAATRAFDIGGSVSDAVRCAVDAGILSRDYLGYAAWAPFRNLACGVPTADVEVLATHGDAGESALRAQASAACAVLGLAGAAAAAAVARPSARMCALGLLIVSALVAPPVATPRAGADEMRAFFYRDATTACLFEIDARVPNGVLQDRLLSVTAPRGLIRDVYNAILRDTRIDGRSLYDLCGHCELRVPDDPALIEHLVLGTPFDAGAVTHDRDTATVHVFIPSFATHAWRTAHARALRETLMAWKDEPRVAVASRDVAAADVRAAVDVGAPTLVASAALAATTLYAAIAHTRRAPASPARVGAIAGVVGLTLVVAWWMGDAWRRALGVPPSPYGAVVIPLLLGTGVDGALLLLHVHGRTGGFGHAWPSLLGAQLTTAVAFAGGMWIAVPHLRALFVTCACTQAASVALQLAVLPPVIARWSRRRRGARGTSGKATAAVTSTNTPRHRVGLLWRPALASLVVLWLVLLPRLRPVGTSSDLSYVVPRHSPTRRFLDATGMGAAAHGRAPSPFYVLARDSSAVDWDAVRADVTRDGGTILFDWHAAYEASDAPNASSFAARSTTTLAFGSLLAPAPSRASVLVALVTPPRGGAGAGAGPGHESDDDDDEGQTVAVAALRAWTARPPAGTCYASVDWMGDYTVASVVRDLLWLALVSSVASTLVGVAIAGRHGLVVCVALALSYATMLGVLGATRVPIHLLVVAVFCIAPGFLVDFALHLTYNPDTRGAVAWGALTSVASMAPYAFASLPGVRDFAVVYIGFLVIGLAHAYAATVTRALGGGWEAAAQDEEGDDDDEDDDEDDGDDVVAATKEVTSEAAVPAAAEKEADGCDARV